MRAEHGLHHAPGCLHGVFAGEQRRVTCHDIGEQALIGGLFAGFFFDQHKLVLFTHKGLASLFDARGQRNQGMR